MGGYLAETAPPQRSAGQTMRPCASMASFISLDMTSGPRMRSKARRSSRSTVVGTTWVATVRGTCPTPEAGTRTPYVQYVGLWGQAALCVRYVPNAGGWYA